jgi:hypothetical protein
MRAVDAITQDVRSAVRSLRRTPGVSALVVLSLALGIGANTAIFGLARSVLFEPVPYRDADRVVLVELYLPDLPVRMTARQAAVIAQMHAFERVEASPTEQVDWRRGDSTVRLLSRFVTPQPATPVASIQCAFSATNDSRAPRSSRGVLPFETTSIGHRE